MNRWAGVRRKSMWEASYRANSPQRRTKPWDCFGKETQEYFQNDFLATFTCHMSRYNPKEPRNPRMKLSVGRTKEPTAGTKPPDDGCYINKGF